MKKICSVIRKEKGKAEPWAEPKKQKKRRTNREMEYSILVQGGLRNQI